MIDRDHNGIGFDDLFYSAAKALLLVVSATVTIATLLWVMASPDRPTACAAYSGAEVAACIEETR